MTNQRDSVTPRPIETLLRGDSYPIWSPYASFEAATVLLEALNTQQHV
jgi:hypothetical protein